MTKVLFCLVSLLVLSLSPLESLHAAATLIYGSGDTERYDIVFLGDGFTSSEMDLYHQKVQEATDALLSTDVYNDMRCSLNIWRVDVASNESGIDHPLQNIYRDTALDLSYGDNDPIEERCILSTMGVVRGREDSPPDFSEDPALPVRANHRV